MTDGENRNDSELIERLIAAEEEEALARFRESRFEERLRERVSVARTKPSAFQRPRASFRFAWVCAVSLVALSCLALLIVRGRHPAERTLEAVEENFRLLPGIQALERHRADRSVPASSPHSPLENVIAEALMSLIAAARGSSPGLEGTIPVSSEIGRKSKNLQVLYDLLVTERSVERVLMAIHEKSKEG